MEKQNHITNDIIIYIVGKVEDRIPKIANT